MMERIMEKMEHDGTKWYHWVFWWKKWICSYCVIAPQLFQLCPARWNVISNVDTLARHNRKDPFPSLTSVPFVEFPDLCRCQWTSKRNTCRCTKQNREGSTFRKHLTFTNQIMNHLMKFFTFYWSSSMKISLVFLLNVLYFIRSISRIPTRLTKRFDRCFLRSYTARCWKGGA